MTRTREVVPAALKGIEMRIHEPEPVPQVEVTSARFQDLKDLSYEEGLAAGRETGYKQGFQDGFLAYLKNQNGGINSSVQGEVPSPDELTHNGKRLVGPPCSKCGHCYPGSLQHCPRCKTPPDIFQKAKEHDENVAAKAVSPTTQHA
jgi:hypothetical protein